MPDKLRCLHRKKKDTLYIGDSIIDAQTALLAGVDFVGVLNGMTTREELADFVNRRAAIEAAVVEALEPFAKLAERIMPFLEGAGDEMRLSDMALGELTIGHFRSARAALLKAKS